MSPSQKNDRLWFSSQAKPGPPRTGRDTSGIRADAARSLAVPHLHGSAICSVIKCGNACLKHTKNAPGKASSCHSSRHSDQPQPVQRTAQQESQQPRRANFAQAAAPTPQPAGTAASALLKRYRPLETRAAGGFGSVEICLDGRLQRRVAIKRMPLASPYTHAAAETTRTALAEARTASMLLSRPPTSSPSSTSPMTPGTPIWLWNTSTACRSKSSSRR